MKLPGPVQCCLEFFLTFITCCSLIFAADFDWKLAKGFPVPAVPVDNPMSASRVELGRHLFYDQRLSVNEKQSCASCHKQELAFTDGKARGEGTTGEIHPRSSMSLVNVGYASALTWANPKLDSLEEQALVPMFGTDPVELGPKGAEEKILQKIQKDSVYQKLFSKTFPSDENPFTIQNITKAIAAFERSIVSTRSPYDRYRYGGEPNAISDAAKRGEKVYFSSEKAGCFQCHGGWNFSGSVRYAGGPVPEIEFHNTGLYNLSGEYSYPERNTGIHQFTGKPEDIGKFRAPSLRNIAVTAPYMHDGSIASLEQVIDHYSAGGRSAGNPNKSSIIRGFQLTAQEKSDLIEFLKSLTDEELLKDSRWSNPWPGTPSP